MKDIAEYLRENPYHPCNSEDELQVYQEFETLCDKFHLSEDAQDKFLHLIHNYKCTLLPKNKANMKKLRERQCNLVCSLPAYTSTNLSSMYLCRFGRTQIYILMYYQTNSVSFAQLAMMIPRTRFLKIGVVNNDPQLPATIASRSAHIGCVHIGRAAHTVLRLLVLCRTHFVVGL